MSEEKPTLGELIAPEEPRAEIIKRADGCTRKAYRGANGLFVKKDRVIPSAKQVQDAIRGQLTEPDETGELPIQELIENLKELTRLALTEPKYASAAAKAADTLAKWAGIGTTKELPEVDNRSVVIDNTISVAELNYFVQRDGPIKEWKQLERPTVPDFADSVIEGQLASSPVPEQNQIREHANTRRNASFQIPVTVVPPTT